MEVARRLFPQDFPQGEGRGGCGESLTCCVLPLQLFRLIYRKSDIVHLMARQAGWQDVLTRLYVLEAATTASVLPSSPELPTPPESATAKSHSSGSPESSEVFLPSEVPGSEPETFYQALSPFCLPFDLSLERASVGSGSMTGGSSGTLTPASQPGTPSPLDGPRLFPVVPGRHSSSLSNVLEDSNLLEPTVSGDDSSNTSNPQVRFHPLLLCATRGTTFPEVGTI